MLGFPDFLDFSGFLRFPVFLDSRIPRFPTGPAGAISWIFDEKMHRDGGVDGGGDGGDGGGDGGGAAAAPAGPVGSGFPEILRICHIHAGEGVICVQTS